MSFRLAECIRIGSKETKQCTGMFFQYLEDKVTHSCALGAAALGALGTSGEYISYSVLEEVFPELERRVVIDDLQPKLFRAIEILNDQKKWTREQIADWVETL